MSLRHKEIFFIILLFSVFGIFIPQDVFALNHYSCPSSFSQNEITYELSEDEGQEISENDQTVSLKCSYVAIIDGEDNYVYFQVDFVTFEGQDYEPQENDCSSKVIEVFSAPRINYEYFYTHVYVKESYNIEENEYYSEDAATCFAQNLSSIVVDDAYYCPGFEDLSMALECDPEEEFDVVEISSIATEPQNGLDSEQHIPDWIKNNAAWWSADQITDDDFSMGIEFMIKEGFIKIPTVEAASEKSDEIPSWVKNNAGWWSEGAISDTEFVNGLQFLISNGIIQVS